jgi:hypothetical protein
VLAILAQFPVVGPYTPISLGAPALDLALGNPAGDILGPVLFNIALVPAVFAVTWLVFRHQEL